MKLDTNNRTVDTDIGKAGSFGIKTENMSHIIDILRNKLYTNKHLAVLREYSINAVDAHIAKDIPLTPIKVTLPTMESPTLSIRDYGNGLDDDEILDTYIMYGSSTKRDSNSQTGGLGLGCKAGFAYGDMFNIINYGVNKITHWCAAIDESNLGSIYKTAEQPADGTSGVEIRIAVDLADRGKFQQEAKRLFAFFDVKPDVNLPEDASLDLEVQLYGDNHDWLLLKQDDSSHYTRLNTGKAIALMGNIPYKIDSSKLPHSFEHSDLVDCSRLVIRFPVGSLDIAASRESLEYTTKTANCISIESQKIKNELAQTITDEIKDQESLMAASIEAMKLTSSLPNNLQRDTFDRITWDGSSLVNRFQGKTTIHRHYRNHRWRADDYVNAKEEMYAFKVDRNTRLITYDADELSSTQATLRLRTVQQQDNWDKKLNYYVIPYTKTKVKYRGLPAGYETMSTLPIDKIPINWFSSHKINLLMKTSYHLCGGGGAKDITKLAPMKPQRKVVASDGSVQAYERIDTCIMRPHRSAAGRIVKSNDIEEFNDEVIYIPLNRYTWHDKTIDLEEDNFNRIKKAVALLCEKLGYAGEPVIHGVKKHYLKKLANKWISLDVWYAREFKKLLAKHPTAKRVLPYTNSHHLNDLQVNDSRIAATYRKLAYNKAIKFPGKAELRLIMKAEDFSEDADVAFLISLKAVLGILNKDLIDWKELKDREKVFLDAHPMLRYCEPNWNADSNNLYKEIKEYVTR
jgi:hypothetical protein